MRMVSALILPILLAMLLCETNPQIKEETKMTSCYEPEIVNEMLYGAPVLTYESGEEATDGNDILAVTDVLALNDAVKYYKVEGSNSTIIVYIDECPVSYRGLQLSLARLTDKKLYLCVLDPTNRERVAEIYE